LTSAPTLRRIAAIVDEAQLGGENALAAYLMVSADAGSVMITGALILSYSDET
jgi:hypothetical protein